MNILKEKNPRKEKSLKEEKENQIDIYLLKNK